MKKLFKFIRTELRKIVPPSKKEILKGHGQAIKVHQEVLFDLCRNTNDLIEMYDALLDRLKKVEHDIKVLNIYFILNKHKKKSEGGHEFNN